MMKTSKFILLIAFVLSLMLSPIIAQTDYSDEIIVYIKDGLQKGKSNQVQKIVSEKLGSLFTKYNISQDKIISAFPDFKESDTIKISTDGEKVKLPNMSNIYKIKLSDKNLKETIIKDLQVLPEILFAESNGKAEIDVLPNDQYFSYQWYLQPGTKIKAPEAWDIYTGSTQTKVAVIDEGVDATHPDLNGKVTGNTTIYGYHGTHVAGILGAKTNNTTGVSGVNWNTQILAKAFNDGSVNGDPYIYQIVAEAVNEGSHLLNNSWKLVPTGRYSTLVRMAFAYAYKMNRLAVASIGNTGPTVNTVQYPGSFGQGILSVGATDDGDNIADFSTRGSAIDVSAPGVSILSTFRNGITFSDPNYEYLSGTSMATPVVTGIASLLKGYNPNLYNDDIEQIIRISADDKGDPGWDQYYGTGRVNAYNALNLLRAPYQLSQLSSYGGSYYANTASYTTVIYGASGLADGVYIVERHEVRKNVSFSPRTSINVWGRGVGTVGWSAASPNFSMGYCDVIPGTVTNTSATLRTYVYKVWNIAGQYLGYYPAAPANVNFNYTILGVPAPLTATMSGPDYLASGQVGTYTVTASGGTPPYSYAWSYYVYCSGGPIEEKYAAQTTGVIVPDAVPCGYWFNIYNTTNSVTRMSNGSSFQMKCIVRDANNSTVTVTKDVGGSLSKSSAMDSTNTKTNEIKTELLNNFPNPFNPSTKISYSLKTEGKVSLKIYNTLGEEVIKLVDEIKPAGIYEAEFNASELPSGIYIYRMQSGEYVSSKKMLLIK